MGKHHTDATVNTTATAEAAYTSITLLPERVCASEEQEHESGILLGGEGGETDECARG